MRLFFDLLRHLPPLVEFYAFGGAIERYALLTAFDLALGVILIVATTRSATDPEFVDQRSRALPAQAASVALLAVLFGGVALIVAMPIALPAYIWSLARGLDWRVLFTSPGVWMQIGIMSAGAAFRAHMAFTATTVVKGDAPVEDEATRRAAIEASVGRSRAANAAQATLIATYVALCYLLMSLPGYRALNLLPALYSAALLFYDARPDIGERLFPELWRAPRPVRASAEGRRPVARRKKR